MLGAIIGDLAAWTWEHDRTSFYKQLVRDDAVLSCYGTALYNAAHTFFLPDEKVDVTPMGTPREKSYFGQWLMWQIACAWYGQSLEEKMPSFHCMDKEEYYARFFMRELLTSLRNGATKGAAYHSCEMFENLSKSWQWREENKVDELSSGLLTSIFRAWNAFYLGYDFTSTLHNAVKWPGDIHLIAAIAGAFASAMYGCEFSYMKEKYANDEMTRGDLYYHVLNRKDGCVQRLGQMMIDYDKRERKFFKKNCALTNVERHQWMPSDVNLDQFVFDEEQKNRIVRAWYTDWDNRYGFYLDDGWMYFYRSQVLICRFQFEEYEDGKYRIEHLEDTGEFHDSKELLGWLNENTNQRHLSTPFRV